MLCPRCGIWEVRNDDNYCSLCQNKFVSLDLEIEPSRFLQDDVPPPARLTVINNSSQNEISVQSVRATADWVSVMVSGNGLPFTLGPGQRRNLAVQVDPLDLEDEYAAARIVVESNAGSESVELEVVPPPVMRISTGEYEIFLDERAMEQTFAQIVVDRGAVTVTGISAEPATWASVKTVDDVRFPFDLDARGTSTLELRFNIDEAFLLTLPGKYPAIYDGKLRVKCLEFEREEPFRVRCWLPPAMWIWEEREPCFEAFAGKRGELTLSIQNKDPGDPMGGQGNASLEIQSIEVRNPDGSENHTLVCSESFAEPIRIEGGALRQFRFAFDTPGCGDPVRALGVGRHRVTVIVTTNLYESTRAFPFDITVSSMPIFNGVLALDFGTSNTCCAILGRREDQFVLLPIDSPAHSNHPTTTPTLIHYRDVTPEGKRVFLIGAYVESISNDPRAAGTTVRSPKRNLGRFAEADRFDVRFFYNSEKHASLFAREVVADYLDQVRLAAEEHGKAVFKRIVITHPARFRIQQLRDLEAAVREAFGPDCEISMLQEPVAAAIDFIVSKEALAVERYTLGVFDFGGGTTDLSLMSVENIRENAFTEIRARLISSTGKWFGGEDVTRFVIAAGLGRCQAIARELRKQAEIFTEPKQAADPSRRWLARQNASALQCWAEQTKLLLVKHGDNHEAHMEAQPGIFPSLKLNVFTPSGMEEISFPHQEIVPKQVDLYAYLEKELMTLAHMLRAMVESTPDQRLGYVLLSGKSSAIPLVAEVLRREFPDSNVKIASEPKECVVSGACILEKLQDAADMFLNIDGTAATVSRMGFENVGPGGTKIFEQLAGAGVPIPERGLESIRPMLLSRRKEIRLLENDGEDDALWVLGKENANISELGVFTIESPPDWLLQRPVPAILKLTVSQNLAFSITCTVEGHEDVLTFVQRSVDRVAVV